MKKLFLVWKGLGKHNSWWNGDPDTILEDSESVLKELSCFREDDLPTIKFLNSLKTKERIKVSVEPETYGLGDCSGYTQGYNIVVTTKTTFKRAIKFHQFSPEKLKLVQIPTIA